MPAEIGLGVQIDPKWPEGFYSTARYDNQGEPLSSVSYPMNLNMRTPARSGCEVPFEAVYAYPVVWIVFR